MSNAEASIDIEEEIPVASNVEHEGRRVTKKKSKGKKKGKSKKRTESVEEEDDEDGGLSLGKKKNGKKQTARKVSDASEVQPDVEVVGNTKPLESNARETSMSDGTPRETVVEIKDEKQADELEEIVVKKDETSAEGDEIIKEVEKLGESSGEEKKDVNKDSSRGEEGTQEDKPETVRRRATLSDIRGESFDRGDGQQLPAVATESEVKL